MPIKQNHAGRTFGQITLHEPSPTKPGYWKGTCSCGNPVEKRLDNLKRPGNHTCGKCYQSVQVTDGTLEARVRRLEQVMSQLSPQDEGR